MFICHYRDGDGGHVDQDDLSVWFYRWDALAKPGRYVVTAMWTGHMHCYDAVVDNYGCLVAVP